VVLKVHTKQKTVHWELVWRDFIATQEPIKAAR